MGRAAQLTAAPTVLETPRSARTRQPKAISRPLRSPLDATCPLLLPPRRCRRCVSRSPPVDTAHTARAEGAAAITAAAPTPDPAAATSAPAAHGPAAPAIPAPGPPVRARLSSAPTHPVPRCTRYRYTEVDSEVDSDDSCVTG